MTHPYGYCPICGAMGISRERRLNGNDKCDDGHTYPSRDATPTRSNLSVRLAYQAARFQTDPAWGAKIRADAEQLDEIRRLGT